MLNNIEKYMTLTDYGPSPFITNIHNAAMENCNFRIAYWTGKYLQLTLMSIPVKGEIGLECHPDLDQFIRIEAGYGVAKMGMSRDKLTYEKQVNKECAIFVPAGCWHNLINTGNVPLKLYSIYAPPQHPKCTVHETKEIADMMEH